jgi:internalin A
MDIKLSEKVKLTVKASERFVVDNDFRLRIQNRLLLFTQKVDTEIEVDKFTTEALTALMHVKDITWLNLSVRYSTIPALQRLALLKNLTCLHVSDMRR